MADEPTSLLDAVSKSTITTMWSKRVRELKKPATVTPHEVIGGFLFLSCFFHNRINCTDEIILGGGIMNGTYQVLAYIGLSFGWFTWFVWKRKKHLDHMHGMIIGMAIGMMVGLMTGLLFGAVYQGDLYTSTMWGMILAGSVGFLFGIPLSILCTIEGTFSGIMAGMMGAMLGEMLPADKVVPLLFLFVMLYTASLLLFAKLIETKGKENREEKKWVFTIHNPMLPAVLLTGAFIWYQSLAFSFQFTEKGETTLEVVNLVAVDFSYKPNEFVIKKDIPIKVTLKNGGNVEHDFELVSNKHIVIQPTSDNAHQHENTAAKKVHLHAKPGGTATVVFMATATGTYQFYCTIPGHKESGMVGSITVL